ncbi:MAG: GHKL domain-containing protein [Planctomycetes bacterium]|nr:GHKL domain-containing protein [Planctomycetota bacterium]
MKLAPRHRVPLAVLAVIAGIFGVFEIAERTLLRDADPGLIHYLHMARGIGTSILVGLVVAAHFMSKAVQTLPLRGDQVPQGEHGRSGGRILAERNRWLVRTRWGVLGVVWLGIAVGAFAVPLVPDACRWPLLLVASLIAAVNIVFQRIARGEAQPERLLLAQMAVDLFLLTLLLHFSGGIENPLMGLYVLHVILAGILLDRRAAFGTAVLACLLVAGLAGLEGLGIIPHYSLAIFPHGGTEPLDAAREPRYAVAVPATVSLLVVLAVSLTTSLREGLKESERDLLHNYKFSALGRLSGGLAHEINNPVGIASARVKLLLERTIRSGADETILADLTTIERQLGRVADIVRGMLAYARSTPARRRPVDLGPIIRDVAAGAHPSGRRAPPKLEVELPRDPVPILADPGEISQIAVNLLVNAYEAVPEGGKISVGVGQENGSALFWVEDTGSGMSPEVQSKIFEPFFSTKTERGGTGLGLAIVQGFVSANQGRIHVRSDPGHGSRFEIRFPLHSEGKPSHGPSTRRR